MFQDISLTVYSCCSYAIATLFRRDYLAVKCCLLQRFLHDLVYDSMHPNLLQSFLGFQ